MIIALLLLTSTMMHPWMKSMLLMFMMSMLIIMDDNTVGDHGRNNHITVRAFNARVNSSIHIYIYMAASRLLACKQFSNVAPFQFKHFSPLGPPWGPFSRKKMFAALPRKNFPPSRPWGPHGAPPWGPFPGKNFSRLCRENFFPPSRPWGPHGAPDL